MISSGPCPQPSAPAWRAALSALAVAALLVPASAQINYLVNPGAEQGFTSSAFTLQYVGPAATATFFIDVPNNRFRTYTGGVLDVDIDLADLPSFEEQGDVRAFFDANPDYTTTAIGYAGFPVVDTFSGAGQYTDQSQLPFPGESIKGGGYPVQARLANAWAPGETTTGSSSIFSRTGDYGLNVYDNRQHPTPGHPLAGSPAAVRLEQNVLTAHPNGSDLLGQIVLLEGWARHPTNSIHSDVNGGTITVTHGNGGSIVEEFNVPLTDDAWTAFSHGFTVDAASTEITVRLYAAPTAATASAGNGHVIYDDLSLTLGPIDITEVQVEDTVGLAFATTPDILYRLQSTTDLLPPQVFTNTGAIVEGNGSNMFIFDPAGFDDNKAYRVEEGL